AEKFNPSRFSRCSFGPGKKTCLGGFFADAEEKGVRGGCALARARRNISKCCDHGDLAANQFARQRGQPIKLTLCPAVLDRYVLAFNIAGVFEALMKSAQTVRVCVR